MIDLSKLRGKSYKQAQEELLRQLAAEKTAYGKSDYPIYRGELLAPKSPFTTIARELTSKYAKKPDLPYSKKRETVQKLYNQKIDADSLKGVLQESRDKLKKSLISENTERFGNSAPYINPKLEESLNKSIKTNVDNFLSNINNYQIPNLQNNNNKDLQSLNELFLLMGKDKQINRQKIIDMFAKFGNQDQARNNMILAADKQAFDRELAKPYLNIERVGDFIAKNNYNNLPEEVLPYKTQELVKTANAYNTNLESNNRYTDNRVAKLNPQLEKSYKDLIKIFKITSIDSSPASFSFVQTPKQTQIKDIINGILTQGNVNDETTKRLPEALKSPLEQMFSETLKRNKLDLKRIGNFYAGLGQYGSGAHMKAASKSSKELNKAFGQTAEKLILEGLDHTNKLVSRDREGKIKNAFNLARQNSENYLSNLNKINEENKIGNDIFANEQDEADKKYKDYITQNIWAYPHMRGFALNSMEGTKLDPQTQKLMGENIKLDRNNIAYSENPNVQIPFAQNLQNANTQAPFVEAKNNRQIVNDQIKQINQQRTQNLQKANTNNSNLRFLDDLYKMTTGEDKDFIAGDGLAAHQHLKPTIMEQIGRYKGNPTLINQPAMNSLFHQFNELYGYNPNVYNYLENKYKFYKPNFKYPYRQYPYETQKNFALDLLNNVNTTNFGASTGIGEKQNVQHDLTQMISHPSLFNRGNANKVLDELVNHVYAYAGDSVHNNIKQIYRNHGLEVGNLGHTDFDPWRAHLEKPISNFLVQ